MKDSINDVSALRQANEKLEASLREQAGQLNKIKEALACERTEREQAEKALRESEQYTRSLFELSPIGLALCRMDGSLVDVNPAYAGILGRTVEETRELTYWDVTPLKYHDVEAALLDTLKKTGHYGPYEKEYIHKEGYLVPVRLSGRLIERSGESLIWSSVEDITDRKQSEAEILKTQTFLTSIIENIPHMIFVKEAEELRFIRFNQAGEKLLGYPRGSLIGKNDYDFFPKTEADFFTMKDREVFTRGSVLDILTEVIHTKNGERLLHTKKVPIYNDKGEPQYLLGISEDITEKTRVQQELLQKSEQLARSKAELEQLELFAFAATHDLQEPLRAIIFYSDLLKEQAAETLHSEASLNLERIQKSAVRMSFMMEQLRELSRIETGGRSFEKTDLTGVVQGVLANLELLVSETDGRVEVKNLPTVLGDPTQMEQVFQNLIGNALKFHAPGKPPVVRICGRALEGGFAEISVEDDGIGFDEVYLDRIFKPFQRLHGQKEYSGSGIGLTICQKIVARHGGKLTARSALGQGSVFIMVLPVAAE